MSSPRPTRMPRPRLAKHWAQTSMPLSMCWPCATPPGFPTVNARSEEATGKPLWRDAWKRSRCLIFPTHYYEWQKGEKGRQPYAIAPGDGRGFMFAELHSG